MSYYCQTLTIKASKLLEPFLLSITLGLSTVALSLLNACSCSIAVTVFNFKMMLKPAPTSSGVVQPRPECCHQLHFCIPAPLCGTLNQSH